MLAYFNNDGGKIVMKTFYVICLFLIALAFFNIAYISIDTVNLPILRHSGIVEYQEFKPQHKVEHIKSIRAAVVTIEEEIPDQWILYISINNVGKYIRTTISEELYNTVKFGSNVLVEYTQTRLNGDIIITNVKKNE